LNLDADWARCAPWLDAALDHAGRTHSLGAHSALVAVIEHDPGERRLLIWLAGGEREELETSILPEVEAWARAQQCRRALVIGRAGWERTLKSQGYAPLARIIAKDL
jgi:hypothetical protein